jgi:hypothetical protein
MLNSKNIGNKIGFGCWSSYCGNKQQTQNNKCYNLSGSIIASSPLLVNNTKLNSKFYSKKNIYK